MRKIAIFTATRAEYGLLRRIARLLRDTVSCEMQLIVSGTHLSDAHGATIGEILADGFAPAALVPLDMTSNSRAGICIALGDALARYGKILEELAPDIIVVLGDRYETFAMTAAAHLSGIAVAHIHGGEKTSGAIDDAFRHSITKMAQLHFTACEKYRSRVIQLGEDPTRVWNVGGLGVDALRHLDLIPEKTLREELHLSDTPYFLCTFHPVTLERENPRKQLDELFAAFSLFPDVATVFTSANADAGGGAINKAIQEYVAANPRHYFFASLGQLRYLSAVRYAACVVGNSSSGILEAPSLNVPVVDIGDRQKGRERAKTVYWCEPERRAIAQALRRAMHEERPIAAENPYDRPGTAENIAAVLLEYPLAEVLKKDFYDLY